LPRWTNGAVRGAVACYSYQHAPRKRSSGLARVAMRGIRPKGVVGLADLEEWRPSPKQSLPTQ